MNPISTSHQFGVWLAQHRYSPATVANYRSYVGRAERAVGPLEETDTGRLYQWWTTLSSQPATRNGARKALAAFYRMTDVEPNPAVRLPQLPAPPGRPRPVGEATFTRLRAAAVGLGGEHHTLAVLLATTGCRISEARLARWDQFELDDPAVWLSGFMCHRPFLLLRAATVM